MEMVHLKEEVIVVVEVLQEDLTEAEGKIFFLTQI